VHKAGEILKNVRLSGGLGNQLFQYFAGACKSIETSESLVLNFSQIHLGKVSHGSSLRSIDLPVKYRSRNVELSAFSIFIRKIFLRFENIFFRKSRILNKDNLHHKSILNQNYLSYELVQEHYPDWEAQLISPSRWFDDMFEVTKENRFIALHIRRGDYLEERNFSTIGVLDSDYYEKAIHLLSEQLGPLPIWIFSDSEQENLPIDILNSKRVYWISPPVGADPAESLFLMSRASGIVLANSTFSWWAAIFAAKNAVVCCPEPWFRNLDQPKNLAKSHWKMLPSSWMTNDLKNHV
jgi:hypothetical protein